MFGPPSPSIAVSPQPTVSRLAHSPAYNPSRSPTNQTPFQRHENGRGQGKLLSQLEHDLINLIQSIQSIEPQQGKPEDKSTNNASNHSNASTGVATTDDYYYIYGSGAGSQGKKALVFVSIAHVRATLGTASPPASPPASSQPRQIKLHQTKLLIGVDDVPHLLAASFVAAFMAQNTSTLEAAALVTRLETGLSRLKQTHLLHRHQLYNLPTDNKTTFNDKLTQILRANPMVVPDPDKGGSLPKFKIGIKVSKNLYSTKSRIDLAVNVTSLSPFHLYCFLAQTLKVRDLSKLKVYRSGVGPVRMSDGRVQLLEEHYYKPLEFVVGCGYSGEKRWAKTPTKSASTTPRKTMTPRKKGGTPKRNGVTPFQNRLKLESWDFSLPGEDRRSTVVKHEELDHFMTKQFGSEGNLSLTSVGSSESRGGVARSREEVDERSSSNGSSRSSPQAVREPLQGSGGISVDKSSSSSDNSSSNNNNEGGEKAEELVVEKENLARREEEPVLAAEARACEPFKSSGHLSIDDFNSSDEDCEEDGEGFEEAEKQLAQRESGPFPVSDEGSEEDAGFGHFKSEGGAQPETQVAENVAQLELTEKNLEQLKSGHLSVDDASSSDGDGFGEFEGSGEVEEPAQPESRETEKSLEQLKSGHLSVDDASSSDESNDFGEFEGPGEVEEPVQPEPRETEKSLEQLKSGHLSVDDASSSDDFGEFEGPGEVEEPAQPEPRETEKSLEQLKSGHLSVDDGSSSPLRSLVVCGHELLADHLPGVVMTLSAPLLPHDEDVRLCLTSMGLGMQLRAVPVEVHQRDIAVHASEHGQPGSCARVPLHLRLLTPSSPSPFPSFTIAAPVYNPTLPIDGQSMPVSAVLGLATPLRGLQISATSAAGLVAGCEWLASPAGRAKVAEPSFTSEGELPSSAPTTSADSIDSDFSLSSASSDSDSDDPPEPPAPPVTFTRASIIENNGVPPNQRKLYWLAQTAPTRRGNYWELVRESTRKYKKLQKAVNAAASTSATTEASPKLGWVSVIEMDVQRTYAAAHESMSKEGEEEGGEGKEEDWGSFVTQQSFDDGKGEGKEEGGPAEFANFAEGRQTEQEKHDAWARDTSLRANEEAVVSLLAAMQVNVSAAEHHKKIKKKLRRILWAFTAHDPKVGYTQGMNMVVRWLLEVADGEEENSFHILCGLCEKFKMGEMWGGSKMEYLEACMDELEGKVEKFLPELDEHLKGLGVRVRFAATKWFLTLYSCYGVVGVDVLLLVWDLFLMEGWGAVFGAAIGVLRVLEKQLLAEGELEGVMEILQQPLAEMMWAEEGWGKVIERSVVEGIEAGKGLRKQSGEGGGGAEEDWDWESGDC